jgi:hypothetical protein
MRMGILQKLRIEWAMEGAASLNWYDEREARRRVISLYNAYEENNGKRKQVGSDFEQKEEEDEESLVERYGFGFNRSIEDDYLIR